mgnify:FL=1
MLFLYSKPRTGHQPNKTRLCEFSHGTGFGERSRYEFVLVLCAVQKPDINNTAPISKRFTAH